MRRRRVLVASLAAGILMAATMPSMGALAASPQGVTRAQFIYEFDRTANIQPVYPQVPDFTDVPSTSPYYGYIEASLKAGIVSGVTATKFEPNAALTREEIAKIEVLALGDGQAAKALASQASTFKDDPYIAAWARGYINEAVKLGLISGYPNGYFRPAQAITVADTPHFLQKYATSQGSQGTWSLTVSPSATDVAVGQQVLLASTVKNPQGAAVSGSVTYSVNSAQALVSGSTFVASSPGTYTVTGTYQTYGATITGTAQIAVYGTPTSLKIVTPSQIAANGYSTYTVTVDILDQNGNIVANDNVDQVSLGSSGGGAVSSINPGTTTAVNGVAMFTITAGSVPGASTTLTATDNNITGNGHQATATLTSAMQAAAKLSISAPQYISANITGTTATVKIQVLDQSGQPMLYGVFPFTVSISGPATFTGGSTASQNVVYVGNGQSGSSAPYAVVSIQDVQGATGAITLTASGNGLASASATITAVIAGVASGIAVYPPASTSVTQSTVATGVTFGIGAIDAHGYPVTDAIPVLISVKNSSGTLATNVYVDSQPQDPTSGGYLDTSAMQNGSFELTIHGTTGAVGTYTVQATSPTGLLSSSGVSSFQVTAGTATRINATMGSSYVSAQHPTTTLTVQLVDQYGNPVAESGIPVTLSSPGSNGYPVTFSQSTGYTNGNGQFMATVNVLPYVGETYTVYVTATINGSVVGPNPEPTVSVQNTVATQIQLTPLDYLAGGNSPGNDVNSNYVATSSDMVRLTLKALDQYQNPVTTNDQVTLTFSGSGSLKYQTGPVTVNGNGQWTVQLSGGQAVIDAEAWAAGQLTITAQDASVGGGPTATVPMMISPGNLSNFAFFTTSGANAGSGISVQANTPVEVYLEPVDSQGNATIAPLASTAVPSDGGGGGSFRPNNPYNSNVSSYTVPAGTMQLPFWYVNGTANTYDLTANYQQTPTTLSLSTLPSGMAAGGVYSVTLTAKDQYGDPLNGAFPVELSGPASGLNLLGASPNNSYATVGSAVNGSNSITNGMSLSASGAGTIDLAFSNGTATLYFTPVAAQTNASFNVQVAGTSNVASSGGANVSGGAPYALTSTVSTPSSTVVGTAYNYQINAVDSFGNAAEGAFGATISLTVGGLQVSPNGAEPTVAGVAATTTTGSNPTTAAVIPQGTSSGDFGSMSFSHGALTLPVIFTSATQQKLTFQVSGGGSPVAASNVTPAALSVAYAVALAPSNNPTPPVLSLPTPSYLAGPWSQATVQGATYVSEQTLANSTSYEGVIQLVDAYGNPVGTGTGNSEDIQLTLQNDTGSGTGSASYLGSSGLTETVTLGSNGSGQFTYTANGTGTAPWYDTLTVPKPAGGIGQIVIQLKYQ